MYAQKPREKRRERARKMQMVLSWNSGISEYESGFKKVQPEQPQCCPGCGCGKFHKWGKYERHVIEENSGGRISIRRIRCVKCGKTHSYLPAFCVSRISYSINFIIAILKAFILKLRISLKERIRRAYALWRRFREAENLWLVFLRARGFRDFPADSKERTEKIFTILEKLHKEDNLSSIFFLETGRHFMSAK
jgi:hypothetical protein